MLILYRLTPQPAVDKKVKLPFATKEFCLRNFIKQFGSEEVIICGDNLDEKTRQLLHSLHLKLVESNFGSGAANFMSAVHSAMERKDDEVAYFVEDDFLHRTGARDALLDGISLGAAYVTLYDHPDKYLDPRRGGNPFVKSGGEKTRVLLGQKCHWKYTNSTVMTFAAKVGRIRYDARIIAKYCRGIYPNDFGLFRRLHWRGGTVISSIPGFATHAELAWLTPLYDWQSLEREA